MKAASNKFCKIEYQMYVVLFLNRIIIVLYTLDIYIFERIYYKYVCIK